MHLTSETARPDLAALSTPQRSSDERRRELERLASLCTDRETTVSVAFDDTEALARPDKKGGPDGKGGSGEKGQTDAYEKGRTDAYEILIPTQKYEQPGTDLPAELWDRAVQVAFLFHELGHVSYSDFDRFGQYLDEVDTRWRELFRMVYNTVEDAVVETQVANEFNVTEDFVVLNEVLAARADQRHRQYVALFNLGTTDGTPVQSYTVFEALAVGLLDRGFVDSGRFVEIVDPTNDQRTVHDGRRAVVESLRPAMDNYVTDALSEPDGTRRVDRAHEFFETARQALDGLAPLQNGRLQTAPVRPADARAYAGWGVAPATALPDTESAREHVTGASGRDSRDGEYANRQTIGGAGGEDSTDTGGSGAADGSGVTSGSECTPPPGRVATEELNRVARRRSRAGVSGQTSSRSPLEREARQLLRYVEDDTTDIEEVIVVDPAEDGGDRQRWTAAVRRSQQLQADLATQLRRERRPRDATGHRTGRLDGRRLVAATRGTQRVFTRRESGTLADYTCLIVLDRSGSMEGEPIRTAETATAQLAHALFEVGVDVSVLSVWRDHPCLELPLGGDPTAHVDRLVTERAAASTPLSTAIAVCRRRLSHSDRTDQFVVVVTDGRPDNPDAYTAQLAKCTFPVFGVYIGAETGTHAELFDRITYAETDTLERTLQRLVRQLFTVEA